MDAQDAQQTQDYIDSVLVRSIINTGVDVRSDDQLLTLSTCSYEFEDARFVVVGVLTPIDPVAAPAGSGE